MIKKLLFLLLLGIGLWLSYNSGHLEFEIYGHQVETSVTVVFVVLVLFFVLFYCFNAFISFISGLPKAIKLTRASHRSQDLLTYLEDYQLNLYQGEFKSSERALHSLRKDLSDDSVLLKLLALELRQKAGDSKTLKAIAQELLLLDKTKSIGLDEMIDLAIADGELEVAFAYSLELQMLRCTLDIAKRHIILLTLSKKWSELHKYLLSDLAKQHLPKLLYKNALKLANYMLARQLYKQGDYTGGDLLQGAAYPDEIELGEGGCCYLLLWDFSLVFAPEQLEAMAKLEVVKLLLS